MSQTRTHDYASDLSSEAQNRKLARIIPPGVYEGMQVAVNGTIAPGMLYYRRREAHRGERQCSAALGLKLGKHGRASRRSDLRQTRPDRLSVPVGSFGSAARRDLQGHCGVPAAAPEYPDIPENCIVLARCYMPAGAIVYTEVCRPVRPKRL
jgi:hypothetical protein